MPVLDASTLILLAKSDLLLLLTEETRINIPEEVQQEALARKGSYDALMIEEMIRSGKILVSGSISRDTRKRVQTDFRLEAGEAAAWSWQRKVVSLLERMTVLPSRRLKLCE